MRESEIAELLPCFGPLSSPILQNTHDKENEG